MTAGPRYVAGAAPTLVRNRRRETRDADGLTVVDRDTLARLAAGGSASSIAAALAIPQHAAAGRIARLRIALDVADNDEALDVARDRGLVPTMPAPAEGGAL